MVYQRIRDLREDADMKQRDVAEYLHGLAEMFGLSVRSAERPLALWQSWHVCVQYVEERAPGRGLPQFVVHYDEYFIRSSAGGRED